MKHDVKPGRVDIYSVGLLSDLQGVIHAPRAHRRDAWRGVVRGLRYVCRRLKTRNVRAAKNHFNGYLAEPYDGGTGWTRCGHGWTRGRAYDDLLDHMAGKR